MMLSTQEQWNLNRALAHSIRHGLMSDRQYAYLVERLRQDEETSLLVFGVGHDAALWFGCVEGEAAFVEDDPDYLTFAPANARVYLQRYASQVGRWCETPAPPRLFDHPWDYVLVDGPRGYSPRCPGRQLPITWAHQLATRQIFVHDYERSWERLVCDRILGAPTEIIPSKSPRRGELAVFDV